MQTAIAFFRDERGSYTIEFCLWIPVFFFFLAATIDASMIYLTHNAIWNAARDLARGVTIGQITQENYREELGQTLLIGGNDYYAPEPDWDGSEIKIIIEMSVSDAGAFGIFSVVGDKLVAAVTMRREPPVI